VALDVPLVIGRRPAQQRVASGAQPRLVTVPSPRQEVSSTHVRIEQSGDAVVVTDLRSTNGTVVTGPGGARRLRPGESAVVLAGARVEIGDGNIIEITEAPEEGRE
jgi:pSer/pThr/pTyr-binding forkhead associated (FHA) protein